MEGLVIIGNFEKIDIVTEVAIYVDLSLKFMHFQGILDLFRTSDVFWLDDTFTFG